MPFCANRNKGNQPGIYGFTNRLSTADGNKEGRFAPGGPAGNKKALKHGLYAYQAMLNGKGLDERTLLFKAMREKEQELITALGGDPSPQEQVIIADCVKNMLYVASLDNYLMGLKSLVRKGKPHPVLAIRTQLSPTCARISNPWAQARKQDAHR